MPCYVSQQKITVKKLLNYKPVLERGKRKTKHDNNLIEKNEKKKKEKKTQNRDKKWQKEEMLKHELNNDRNRDEKNTNKTLNNELHLEKQWTVKF